MKTDQAQSALEFELIQPARREEQDCSWLEWQRGAAGDIHDTTAARGRTVRHNEEAVVVDAIAIEQT